MDRKPPRIEMSALALIIMLVLTHINVCAGTEPNIIRVGLSRCSNNTYFCISPSSSCTIMQTNTGSKFTSGADAFTIEAASSGIIVKSKSGNASCNAPSITLIPDDPTGLLTLSCPGVTERKYRGSIEVSMSGGKFRVVNIVEVEDYLPGVLPSEAGESYPQEALRAQAITARTYALCNIRKHKAQGFDICDSTHCQTYNGMTAEKPKCSQAVLDTRGMVLTYGGQIAEVMYSTDCGGATVNYCETHPGSNFPYLCGAVDPDDIPHVTWEQAYTLQNLSSRLVAAGIKEADGLQSVAITKFGSTGRPLEIQITGAAGKATVTTEKIRAALGLKSTMFSIETGNDGKIILKGKGAGHGIGLCQAGAKGLASVPHNYTCAQILAHYFPGTHITGGSPPDEMTSTSAVAESPVKKTIVISSFPASKQKDKPAQDSKALPDIFFNVKLSVPDRL